MDDYIEQRYFRGEIGALLLINKQLEKVLKHEEFSSEM